MKYNTVTELLSDKSRWTYGVFARDKHGLSADCEGSEAVCYCAFGAIMKVYGQLGSEYDKLNAILFNHGYVGLMVVNDQLGYDTVYPLIVESGI